MLHSLSIRDVVLIDRLDLECQPGLTVLTGETGAGKSILLDALGLALGQRADVGLIRAGCAQATVTAAFDVPANNPVSVVLAAGGLDIDPDHEGIVLRRQIGTDGRSRGFINDAPASARLMRDVADCLIEIDGQFEAQGLLDPRSHRDLFDRFANVEALRASVAEAHNLWQSARRALVDNQAQAERLREERARLTELSAEIESLAPETGEAERLASERELLMHQEQIVAALNEAMATLDGDGQANGLDQLRAARGRLDRVADKAGQGFKPALEALDRAMIETEEAVAGLAAFGSQLEAEPDRLGHVDDRLYALRSLARKHGVSADDLAELAERMRADLQTLDERDEVLGRLVQDAEQAFEAFAGACAKLTAARRGAAKRLTRKVMAELPALRLDRAVFGVALDPRPKSAWAADGAEDVRFTAATNPGAAAGPLHKVASGGELARFMLALKVVLAHASPVATLVFDEVDSGVGGATAAAVGARLSALSGDLQVLVVTHSPQVAARGDQHWKVMKRERGGSAITSVEVLDGAARLEEVARMLSGERVTAEARGAAARLLEPAA